MGRLRQWMEICWSTMKSRLMISHSLGQSRAILSRTNGSELGRGNVPSLRELKKTLAQVNTQNFSPAVVFVVIC